MTGDQQGRRRNGIRVSSGTQWQMGKTAQSIHFVNDAQDLLSIMKESYKQEVLRDAIRRIKSGELVLRRWTKLEEYLEKNSPPSTTA